MAARSEVNERTVYRYFPSERALRDAVLVRLEQESGVELDGMQLEDVADVTARMFEYVSSFPLAPRTPPDPTVLAANQRQREALLSAVAAAAGTSPPPEPTIAAAMLDVLWSVVSYERLVAEWGLDPEDAIRGLTWVIGLVEDAIRAGHAPVARDG